MVMVLSTNRRERRRQSGDAMAPSVWGGLLLTLFTLVSALPLLLPSFPPLIDLPAHLSGYYVQENYHSVPMISRFYSFDWKWIPNLGVELLVAGLAPLIGLTLAVRLIISAIPVIMAAGMLWTAREVHGRIPATTFFALPLAYGYPLIFGFVNFWMAVSAVFVGLGLWLNLTRHGRFVTRSIVFALVAPIILLSHIFGYLILGLMIGGAEIGAQLNKGVSVRVSMMRAIVACLPLAWPLLALSLWHGGTSPGSSGWFDWSAKLIGFVVLMREQVRWWDLFTAGVIYGIAASPLLTRRFRYIATLAIPAAMLWSLTILLPTNLFGSDFTSVRLVPVACALTILSVYPKQPLSWAWSAAGLLLTAARLVTTSVHMIAADNEIQRQLGALDHVRHGSRVTSLYLFECDRSWAPPRLQHLGSYATSRRTALSNDQFARSEGHLLSFAPDVKSEPAPSIVSRVPCERWPLPSLKETVSKLSDRNSDYVWIIDPNPGNKVPANIGMRVVWKYRGSALYSLR